MSQEESKTMPMQIVLGGGGGGVGWWQTTCIMGFEKVGIKMARFKSFSSTVKVD